MNHVKNPNSNIQPDKHRSRKLQQTPVRAASDIFCDRWKHRRGGAIIVGGQKCWWVAADRDPSAIW